MYYIGVNSFEDNHAVFITLMHRKTAKRVYEPSVCRVYENLSQDELKSVLSGYYTCEDFMLLKKKFSQSGRPPRKVLTPPYFVFSENKSVLDIINDLRAGFYFSSFNPDTTENNAFYNTDDEILDYLKLVYNEKRVNFCNYKGDKSFIEEFENINSCTSAKNLSSGLKSFGLIVFFNEVVNKKIKRY